MHFTFSKWPLVFLNLLAILMVACSPAAAEATALPTDTAVAEAETLPTDTAIAEAPITEEVVAAAVTEEEATVESAPATAVMLDQGAVPGMAAGDKVFAWVAPGAAPGRQGASAPGELVFFSSDGEMETVLALPQGTTRVTACGDNATSPDGSVFAFMTSVTAGGSETATLYLISGTDPNLQEVATELNPISCVGSSSFKFTPDSSQYGYIDWPADANNAESPRGRLLIEATGDSSEVGNFENVTDFTFTETGAAFVSFFTNDRNQATEVGIFVWDGTTDREVNTLLANEDCYYTSASIEDVADGRLAVILGYRCTSGETSTQWELHLVDPESRSAQLETSDIAAGRYFGFSDTNAIFAAPDATDIFFTVPDGISNQSVSLLTTPLDAVEPTVLLDRSALMPSVSDLPYDANNVVAQVSPDDRYLAIVVNTPNNDATLHIYDMLDPSLPPIMIDAGDQGDVISMMEFTADSNTLYYVSGADEGGDNSLFALDLQTGSEARITRGRFAQGAVAPDGSLIAMMQWVVYDEDEDPYLTLEIIDTATTAETTVFVGGEVNDEGDLINQQFAYPLAWLQPN
jgi:Tol biopolymer transport system component